MSDMDDSRKLRRALSAFMTGVTVVTARAANGEPVGFTANSFTSVSLDPPLLLVCPGRHLSSFDVFGTVERFAVNVLSEGQEAVSNVFASVSEDRFSQVSWTPDKHACPLIDDACARFSCRVHQRHEAGDHLIVVGEITGFERSAMRGLGYADGDYFSLGAEQGSDTNRRAGMQGRACALIEQNGWLLMVAGDTGLHLPAIELEDGAGARSALAAHLSASHLDLVPGPVYSVYDDRARGTHTTVFRARARTGDVGDVGDIGQWIAIGDLPTHRIAYAAERSMLTRFQIERRNGDFGLYLGTSEAGEVHDTNSSQD